MKIFIAGSFAARERLWYARARLLAMGYEVESSWLDQEGEIWPDYQAAALVAGRDIVELKAADVFILDTLDLTTFGNSYVEYGIALGRMMRKYVIGPLRNHYTLLCTKHFKDWDEFYAFLGNGQSV